MVKIPSVFAVVFAEEEFDEGNMGLVWDMPTTRVFVFKNEKQALTSLKEWFYDYNDHTLGFLIVNSETNHVSQYFLERGKFHLKKGVVKA